MINGLYCLLQEKRGGGLKFLDCKRAQNSSVSPWGTFYALGLIPCPKHKFPP